MAPTTISNPEDRQAALEAQISADGRTESDVRCEALAEDLRGTNMSARQLRFGMVDGGTATTSTEVDDILTTTGFGTVEKLLADRRQGRASYTLLKGVSATRRKRVKPASVTICRIAASPAWAPRA